MNLEDTFAINEVIANYSYTWDSADPDGWANIFTDDAVWESYHKGAVDPETRVVSRAALRKFAADRFGRRNGEQSRHYQTGTVFLELTAETARTRTMVAVALLPAGEITANINWTGIYIDDWRKTENGWKITRRALHHDRTPPST
jgi:hypothetical protein